MSERGFLKEKDLLLNSIEKNTVVHWEKYYSNVPIKCIFEDLVIDINEIKRLTEENQEFKNQLETLEKLNNQLISKLDRYDAIVDERDELKKQLENKYEKIGTLTSELLYEENTKLINQQKAFINYLQKEINQYASHIEAIDSVCTSIYSSDYDNSKIKLAIYKEILQKYREIVNGTERN